MSAGFEKMVHKKNVWNSYFISLPSPSLKWWGWLLFSRTCDCECVCVNAGNRTRASWFQACPHPLWPISSSRMSFLTDLLYEERETLPVANNVMFIVTVFLRSYSYILSEKTDWEYWEDGQAQGFCLLCLLCSCPFSYELSSCAGLSRCRHSCTFLGPRLKLVLSLQLCSSLYWLFVCPIPLAIISLL